MGRIKGEVGTSKKVKALSLLASDLFSRPWGPASLFYFLAKLAGGLLWEFCQA